MIVRVRVSNTIREHYASRGIWPAIATSSSEHHNVSADCARLMREDALAMLEAASVRGGDRVAYRALAEQLEPLAGPEPARAPRRLLPQRERKP